MKGITSKCLYATRISTGIFPLYHKSNKQIIYARHLNTSIRNLSSCSYQLSSLKNVYVNGNQSSKKVDRVNLGHLSPIRLYLPYSTNSTQLLGIALGPKYSQERNLSSWSSIFSQFGLVHADSGSTADGDPSLPPPPPEPIIPDPPHASPVVSSSTADLDGLEYLSLPPTGTPEIDPSFLTALGEPSLASLDLIGWTPVGGLLKCLELFHVYAGLPWWGSVVALTVLLRTALFPVLVFSQRNSAKMMNASPQMQVLQLKITEAKQSGDQMSVARYSSELLMFMNKNDLNPMKSMGLLFCQIPIFLSMFVGLRRCANLPVDSMTTGGAFWFMDLTVPDPIYVLPVLTSVTMFLTIHLGTEAGRISNPAPSAKVIMTAMKFIPLVTLPFITTFPSILVCYWFSTNVVSLVQASLLRVPSIRTALNIPQLVKHDPNALPLTTQNSQKGAIATAREAYKNMKISQEIMNRERYDEVRFQKAGTGPVIKTFKYDPTKGLNKVTTKGVSTTSRSLTPQQK